MIKGHRQPVFQSADIINLAKGASTTLVGGLAGRSIQLLGQIALARILGPGLFGLYAIGWTILRMVGLIAPLGLDKGVIRFGSRYWRRNQANLKSVLFQSLGLTLFSGILIGGSLYLFSSWIAEQVFQKQDLTMVIQWFALGVPLIAGLNVAAATTQISQRMKFLVYSKDVGQPVTNLLLIGVFYLLGWRLVGALVAAIGSIGLAFILAVYYVKKLFPEVFSSQTNSTLVVKELITFSLPACFAGVFTSFIVWVDKLIVGYFLPSFQVGIYQVAFQFSIIFAIILGSFNAIFSPVIVDLYHKKEMGQLEELFRVGTKWGLYLSFPLFLIICFAPREVITIVFGTRYENGCSALVILSIAQMINVGSGAVGLLLVMTGHQNRWLIMSGVALFTNIAINWILVPRWGLVGAAFGTACTLGGLCLSGLLLVKHTLGIWPYDRRYLKGLLASTLAIGSLLLFRTISIDSPRLGLLLTIIISISVFGGALLLLGMDNEDQELLRWIRAHLRQIRKVSEL